MTEKMVKITMRDRLANRTNTGSQPKWQIGDIWHKMDDGNYEGLAETVVSDLLGKSNIESYAAYEPELIEYKGKTARGCRSRDFLTDREELLESTELLAIYGMGHAAKDEPDSIQDPEASIRGFVDAMQHITALNGFDVYLAKMLELDMIVLNADRHFGNITVLRMPEGYGYSPMFDHGRSLALRDDLWKSSKTTEEIIGSIEARPFSRIFARQVRIAEKIAGGPQFHTAYGMADLRATLNRCASVYPDGILKRAEQVFAVQMQRHIDYFTGKESLEILEKYKEKIEKGIRHPVQSRIEDGGLVARLADEPGEVFLRIGPSGQINVMKGEKLLSVEETIMGHSGIIQLYREIAEILRTKK